MPILQPIAVTTGMPHADRLKPERLSQSPARVMRLSPLA